MIKGQEAADLLNQVEEQSGDWRVALGMAQEMVTAAEGHEVVIFEWSTKHGTCQDCGLPAAYRLSNEVYANREPVLLCSVDAAYHAAQGEEIEYLFKELEE